MALLRLNDLNSHYRHAFGGQDIKQFDVYTGRNEFIGNVVDALVDEVGRVQYLILNLHPSIAAKQVVLPFDRARIDLQGRRVHVDTLSVSEAGSLPIYHAATAQSSDYAAGTTAPSASVSRTHPPTVLEASAPLETSTPLESPIPLEGWGVVQSAPVRREGATPAQPPVIMEPVGYDERPVEAAIPRSAAPVGEVKRDAIAQPISKPDLTVAEQETVRLLEERLLVNRQKRKVGEVIVRKAIETRIVEVPVRREMLIVEQVSPERKQLASIDLGQEHLEGVELRDAVQAESRPVVRREFSSPREASQFLQAIADQPNSGGETVQVTIVVNDPSLQKAYQHWPE